jgi:hypothetical protein
MAKGSHTPSNPTKMPSVPTGPSAGAKSSPSKVMNPMPKAGKTTPKGGPSGRSSVNPKSSGQTVDGGPKR